MRNHLSLYSEPYSGLFRAITIVVILVYQGFGQTASTGALTGASLDPTGAALPGVVVRLTNQDTSTTESTTSDEQGRFSFLLLTPGRYELRASTTASNTLTLIAGTTIKINVTETV